MTTPALDERRYDAVTVVFHWATAVLVIALFGSAKAWTYAPQDWGLRWLASMHVSLGIALALAVLGRLIWRMTAGRRIADDNGNPIAHALAKIVHLALYGLLIVQVLLGFGAEWFGGSALSFFGLFEIPTPLAQNRDLSQRLEQMHEIVAWTIMALVGGHAGAALWHRYIVGDTVLQRMLPSAPTR